ncbi:MAG: (Fe-S)-binding protein [Cyanobacteria bacterium SIG29]|nr:(Fe-S)-binding protein [Cyanobacteria bacterium SIG29]
MEKIIKEEVYKCSKCGLCQSVCPIYIATKNESYLTRGKCIILNNHFNNKLKLSKKFIKNLDVCLNCNLCKDFCPSNINMFEINTILKNKYDKKIIPFSFIYKIILNFYRIFNIKRNYKLQNKSSQNSIIYFEGCYNKYIDKSDKNASLELIEKLNYKVEKIISNCCGYPYLNEGNIEKFNTNLKEIAEQCNSNIKYIVCSCDSCYEMLMKSDNSEFKSKLIRLDELLKQHNYELPNNYQYFKPLIRKDECYIGHDIKNINAKGICSTMENFFAFKHPKIAKKLKNYDNDELKINGIFTSCNLTKWGLYKTLNFKIKSYSEYAIKKIID